jgi:hypothetical protein
VTVNCSAPTKVEVDAAEKVLAEAHGQHPDGYWRDLARECLERASEAQLAGFIAVVDREIEGREVPDRLLRDVLDPERYAGLVSDQALDAALGEGRR